jgi:hypothetical protein
MYMVKYDFKSHSSGLKYEFAMSISRPNIIWINGPYEASVHDITIFRGGKADEKEEDWDKNSYLGMERVWVIAVMRGSQIRLLSQTMTGQRD